MTQAEIYADETAALEKELAMHTARLPITPILYARRARLMAGQPYKSSPYDVMMHDRVGLPPDPTTPKKFIDGKVLGHRVFTAFSKRQIISVRGVEEPGHEKTDYDVSSLHISTGEITDWVIESVVKKRSTSSVRAKETTLWLSDGGSTNDEDPLERLMKPPVTASLTFTEGYPVGTFVSEGSKETVSDAVQLVKALAGIYEKFGHLPILNASPVMAKQMHEQAGETPADILN